MIDLISLLSHAVGPGTLKGGLKVANRIAGDGRFDGSIEEIQRFMDGPVWTKHRCDNFQDFLDDHQDDVSEFFDNVGDTISGAANAVVDNAEDALVAIGDFLGDLF